MDNIPAGYNNEGNSAYDKWIDLSEAKEISKGVVNKRTVEKWFDDDSKMFVKKIKEVKVKRKVISRKAFLGVVEAYKDKLVNNT